VFLLAKCRDVRRWTPKEVAEFAELKKAQLLAAAVRLLLLSTFVSCVF
jgi:hypothetical protein